MWEKYLTLSLCLLLCLYPTALRANPTKEINCISMAQLATNWSPTWTRLTPIWLQLEPTSDQIDPTRYRPNVHAKCYQSTKNRNVATNCACLAVRVRLTSVMDCSPHRVQKKNCTDIQVGLKLAPQQVQFVATFLLKELHLPGSQMMGRYTGQICS